MKLSRAAAASVRGEATEPSRREVRKALSDVDGTGLVNYAVCSYTQ